MSEKIPSHLPVFVCYSHEDNEPKEPLSKRWLDRLLQQLAPLAIQDQVCAWSDKDIETGQDWHQRIQQTLENVKAAVLLISPGFLASTYIRNSELPVLLKNAQNRGVVIIPVIVRHCLFEEATFQYPDPVKGPEQLCLASLQSANSPSTPLNSLPEDEQDKVLLGVAQSLLGILRKSSSPPTTPVGTSSQPIWNVPFERNPFFTGREDILGKIREELLSSSRAAFSGLGGIGTTQTAIEYAYRHKQDYSHIFWGKTDSKESLTSDFAQLASLLNLPEKDAQDQQEVINAVLRWLQQHDQWLLILDNADDLSLTASFIQGLQSGHVLLTTRTQATGTISRVEVQKLLEQEGVTFLLRRAKLITHDAPYEKIPQEQRTQALAIVKDLDGLPLALDQAGAYIEETQCGLAGYFQLYQTEGVELLKERGLFAPGHPDPVATTWALSFQQIEQTDPAAAELLRFCAFLHPDAIPEELLTDAASELGPILGPVAENPGLLNKAIGNILKFSLIHRDMNIKMLDIHRLVQTVIQDSLNQEIQLQWIERVVRAMKVVFPDVKFENWGQCDRILSQAQQCAMLISKNNLTLPEGALVLHQTGRYLTDRARYDEAEPLYQRALEIWEQALGSLHAHVATCLNGLAGLYYLQGQYAKAEPLYQRALAIREQALGSTHPNVATSLNNLALLYAEQEKYVLAERLFKRALSIEEQVSGSIHPDVATKLNNLATLYQQQGKYGEAEPLHQRALSIREQALGPKHPHVATSLNNLGLLYNDLKSYPKAQAFYQHALTISEETLGPLHPDVATTLNNLALHHQRQGNYRKAEAFLLRVLNIWEHSLGPTHPSVGTCLNNLAWLYHQEGNFAKAEPIYKRAIGIWEERFGPNHPNTIKGRRNYRDLLKKMKQKKKKVERGK